VVGEEATQQLFSASLNEEESSALTTSFTIQLPSYPKPDDGQMPLGTRLSDSFGYSHDNLPITTGPEELKNTHYATRKAASVTETNSPSESANGRAITSTTVSESSAASQDKDRTCRYCKKSNSDLKCGHNGMLTKSALRKHEGWCSLEPNLQCRTPGCNQKFKDNRDLGRHEDTHNKTMVYICGWPSGDGCQTEIARKDNVRRHLRVVHRLNGKEIKAYVCCLNFDLVAEADES
jgi:hypothetical protein